MKRWCYTTSTFDNYYYSQYGDSIYTLGSQSNKHLETAGSLGHQQGFASLTLSIRFGLDIAFSVGRVSLGNGHDMVENR